MRQRIEQSWGYQHGQAGGAKAGRAGPRYERAAIYIPRLSRARGSQTSEPALPDVVCGRKLLAGTVAGDQPCHGNPIRRVDSAESSAAARTRLDQRPNGATKKVLEEDAVRH